MRMIEELYHGNINPNGNIKTDENYANLMSEIISIEEMLLSMLSGEQKVLFIKYADIWSTINGTDSVENFVQGFKLGGKIGFEINNYEDLERMIKSDRIVLSKNIAKKAK